MISRRTMVIGLVPALYSQAAIARLSCRDYPPFRRCSVGLDINVDTARQQRQNWCWAACVEAIFKFHGYSVSQKAIVDKVFGADVDLPAIGPQIISAVDGQWTDDNGASFDASATVLWDTQFNFGRPDAVLEAARQLENDRPLIIGALGHATVLTAMTYSGNGFNTQLEQLVVRDPWPGRPNRRLLTAQEALATQFLARIDVA